MTIALLSTSAARRDGRDENGERVYAASDRLVELTDAGHEVFIVSTRPVMYPDGCDKCLFDLIPKDRFMTPCPAMVKDDKDNERFGANAPSLVDLWSRALARFGVAVPAARIGRSGRQIPPTWMDLRDAAEAAGIVTR